MNNLKIAQQAFSWIGKKAKEKTDLETEITLLRVENARLKAELTALHRKARRG